MATNETDIVVKEAPCLDCRHLIGFPYCEAFPDGIPEEIQTGENQHDSPSPGDRGIQFEPLEEAPKTTMRDKLKAALRRKQG